MRDVYDLMTVCSGEEVDMSGKEIDRMYDRIKDGRYYKAMIHDSPVAMLMSG